MCLHYYGYYTVWTFPTKFCSALEENLFAISTLAAREVCSNYCKSALAQTGRNNFNKVIKMLLVIKCVCVYICLRDASLGKNCPVFIKGGAKIDL